ncbi:MAG: hypothetical protein H6977_06755 [Gammaproteobacteria bacterium]|nr:hypothetical protein [Gammaproteobacteria bacterium]MCP5199692.1 hypothetical protein [Gammaproteobacteria bacterium]
MTTLCIDDLAPRATRKPDPRSHDPAAIEITRHARARMRRLGVSEFFLDLLLRFGNARRAGDGRRIRYFGRGAFRRMENYFGSFFGAAHREGLFDCYLVEAAAGDRVITLGFLREPRQRRAGTAPPRRALPPGTRSHALPRK